MTIARETAKKLVEAAAEKVTEAAAEKLTDAAAEKVTDAAAEKLSTPALETRMEAAAHSACKFFGLPEPELRADTGIGVQMNRADWTMQGDTFLYNLGEFKDLNSLSFEDMCKVWAHECGHRVLRFYNLGAWANELGADYFMGVRSEMLGLPNGNLEKALGKTAGSLSHPPGQLRLQAIQYGREAVRDFKKANVPVTMQNMRETFRTSHFARLQMGRQTDAVAAFVDDKQWHCKEAALAKENANYYTKEAQKALQSGDESRAKDMAKKAEKYDQKYKDEVDAANRCQAKDVASNRLVDASPGQETVEGGRCPRNNGKWEGAEGNSRFVPDNEVVPKVHNPNGLAWSDIKQKYDFEGVTFRDGYPDFSEVSKATVEIDDFTDQRRGAGGNFDQADRKVAEKRGCSVEEVRQWRCDNGYTWHEAEDCRTLLKVPSEVHGNIPHNGGISKFKNAV